MALPIEHHPVELKTVSFYEDTLEAIRFDGKVYVSLRRCCECLDVDFSSQHKRLSDRERSPWATMVVMTTVAKDGKEREVAMIDLDTLPMWLATIDASRVDEAVRPKLLRYQQECAKVLRDHFFGKPEEDPVLASLNAALEVRRNQIEMARRLEATRQLAAQADTKADFAIESASEAQRTADAALHQADSNHGYFSVLGYARRHNRELPVAEAARHGRSLTGICRQSGVEVHQLTDPRFGRVNAYPQSVLDAYFAQQGW